MTKAIPPLLLGMALAQPTAVVADVVFNKHFLWSWSIYFWSVVLIVSSALTALLFAIAISLEGENR
jgi:hypothetical protein